MVASLVKALWSDYAPRLYESGEKGYQVFLEILEIYEEVMAAIQAVKKGAHLSKETGLPRTIANAEKREKVRRYFDIAKGDLILWKNQQS